MVRTIAVIGVAILVGFLAGSGSVYGFNHLPDGWLYVDESERHWQRVKSTPWKLALSAVFIVCAMRLGLADSARAPGIFAAVFILVWVAMASKLYRVVPRPLVWLLLICGIDILPFEQDFKNKILGAGVMLVIGCAICAILYVLKKKPLRLDLLELMVAVGFLTGLLQSLVIFQAALIFWAIRSLASSWKGKEDLSFFFAVIAAIWMTVNIGHAIM